MSTQQPNYTPLAELASSVGTAQPCAGNLPVKLSDPDSIWFIERGSVNLFFVELKDDVEQTAPEFLMSRTAGSLLPGVIPSQRDVGTGTVLHLIAKGAPGTQLQRLPVSMLTQAHPAEVGQQIDTWLNAMTESLSRFTNPLPRPTNLVKPGIIETSTNCTLSVNRTVVWVSIPAQGSVLFMDIINQADIIAASAQRDIMMPLTRTSWLTQFEEASLNGVSSEALAARGELMSALTSFHSIALHIEQLNRRLAVADEINLERARTTSRRTTEAVARQQLFNIYDLPTDPESAVEDNALADALHIIGEHERIHFRVPRPSTPTQDPVDLYQVLDASGVRARRVRFKAEGKWWLSNSGALLAFRADTGKPVALLPGMFGRYREIDPVTKRSVRLSAARAKALKDEAWAFYRPLPAGEAQPTGLLSFIFHGATAEICFLMLAGFVQGLTRLAPALALGFVANQAAANAGAGSLYAMVAALAGFGLLSGLFYMLQNTTVMRLHGRSTSRIEAAFWDHLMRMPANVLQRYPAGDLAMLGMSFQKMRDNLNSAVADSLLSVIFLLPIIGIIFFYDTLLGFTALVFSLLSLVVTVALGLSQIWPYGRMISASRRVTGRLFQIIGNITKLRVQGAEGSAFAIWARDYREQKRAEIDLSAVEEHSRAFGTALPFVAAGVMLFAVMQGPEQSVPVGNILVVYALFMIYQMTIARLGNSFGNIAVTVRSFEQMKPLLSETPESQNGGDPVNFLAGNVLFDRISFRYEVDGPLILDDVTIQVRAGEFIAITGASGAGKSTLFRLALGVDQPTSGAVFYDDRDLRHLNLKQVRQNIGSVPQSVQLHPQDLWDNLVGHHDSVDAEEVWSAVRLAQIEEEIKNMPMGMMTMVGSSDGILSGGESQRISIARSVLRDPRIMLFDEATNWLDNEKQAKVMENLSKLTSTRIVIAHRLSTLQNADRIYVLDAGKIVQCGSYAELIEIDGKFKELVQRQMS